MPDIPNPSYESDITEEEHERLVLMSEHAIAPPLSPAARSVFEAFNRKFEWIQDGVPGPQFSAIAAALRAAADQLGESRAPGAEFEDLYPRIIEIDDLLAIATELEAQ